MINSQKYPFWSRCIDRIDFDSHSGCADWTGPPDKDGYGRVTVAGRRARAHVHSWESFHGRPVPHGHVIAHTCDSPACVQPAHLSPMTRYQVVALRQARDRQAKGSRNGRSKLTEAQVATLKRQLSAGLIPLAHLARSLGVHPTTVRHIKQGHTWRHMPP